MKPEFKNCIDCKTLFLQKRENQVRCPACQEIRNRELRKTYRKECKKPEKAPDPNECKRKKSCRYSGKMSGMLICNYLSITGERRGCPVQGCTKYKRKPRLKKQEV